MCAALIVSLQQLRNLLRVRTGRMYVRPLMMRLVLLICFIVLFMRTALEVLKLFGEFDSSTLTGF
jgi:hypothetical protein